MRAKEAGRSSPGHKLPRSVESRAGVPASCEGQVVLLRADIHQEVAVGVADVEQFRPRDRGIFRLSLNHYQLRRFGFDDDLRRRARLDLFLCLRRLFCLLLLRLFLFWIDLRRSGGHFRRDALRQRPFALDLLCRIPGVDIGVEPVRLRRGSVEKREGGVDHPLEAGVLLLHEPGIAVEGDKDRRLPGDEDFRRPGFDLLGSLQAGFNDFQRRQEAIHVDRQVPLGNLSLQQGGQLFRHGVVLVGKPHLRHLHFGDGGGPVCPVGLQARFKPEGTEDRFLLALELHGYGSPP